jgi:hypothetical protein
MRAHVSGQMMFSREQGNIDEYQEASTNLKFQSSVFRFPPTGAQVSTWETDDSATWQPTGS